jgi:hypothetical protein
LGSVAARPPTDAAYAPNAHVDVDGAAEVVVGDDGDTGYVAASDGFATVDVSSPDALTVLADRRNLAADQSNGPLTSILDVKVDGDRLLVPGPAQQGSLQGFLLYDVSDPADPQQVGDFFGTDHSIHNAFLVDGYAYLQAGLGMHVVDVSDPPFESVIQWSPVDVDSAWGDVGPYSRVLHDIWVQDDRAYLAHWDSGTFVLDVSDPAAPEFLGRFGDYTLEELRGWSSSRSQGEYLTPKGNAHYVTTDESGTLAGVGAESWSQDGEGGPSGIDLYDVSDPANAELLSTIHPPGSPSNAYSGGTWTTSHNFELANDRLYSSWYQGGVMIHDVSDPRSPERIAWWRNTDDGFWTAQLARSGSHFVATTAAQAGTASNTRLYVFPDEAGEQADPPSEITEPEPPSTSGGTTTTAPGTTTGSAGTTSGDGTTTRPDDVTTTADESNGGSPGLGVVSALAGVGIGAWRLGKRRSGD